jgi:hypothetical protein
MVNDPSVEREETSGGDPVGDPKEMDPGMTRREGTSLPDNPVANEGIPEERPNT